MKLPNLRKIKAKYPVYFSTSVFLIIIIIPIIVLNVFGIGNHFATVYSSTPNSGTLGTDGQINAIAPDASGGVYIGGTFTLVGQVTGKGVPIFTSTGSTTATFPKVNASINTVVQDGAGGWYIGGAFTQVGTYTRNRLAHILSDGSVDPNFDPNADNTVSSMTLSTSTSILYIGGAFATIGGVAQNRLAAVNTSDGSLVSTFNLTPNGSVNTMVLSTSTGILYIGGIFTFIGQYSGSGVPVSSNTGVATSTFPKINSSITVVISDNSNGWYIGGAFTQVGTFTRNRLAHIFSDGSVDPNFNPNVSGVNVAGMALSTSTGILYIGGNFSTVGGVSRTHIAAVNTSDGSLVTIFNPTPNIAGVVSNMALSTSSDILYIGGSFSTINGTTRNRIAAVNTSDGSLVSTFNPNADSSVNTMVLSTSTGILYIGGGFSTIGGVGRNHIAAVNTSDGSLVGAFNPNANSTIDAVTFSTSTQILYIGGSFSTIGGVAHNLIAAVNTSDGSLVTTFDPNPSGALGNVKTIVFSLDGSVLYFGGTFTSVGATTRNNVAAVNTSDGSLISGFNPSVGTTVSSMAISSNNLIYIGGGFINIGVESRNRIAAIKTSDVSLVNGFDPNANGTVSTLALSTSTSILYMGGAFTTIGVTTRNRIAAVNTSDGSLVSTFNPNSNSTVNAIILSPDGNTLYLGGAFTTIGVTTRNRISAVNTSDGSLVSAFDPNANSTVSALTISSNGNILYLGGSFTTIGTTTHNRIVAVNAADGSLVSTFNPSTNNTVNTLALSSDENTLYAGGLFTLFNLITRNRIAHIFSDGSVDPDFNPNASGTVSALILSTASNILYMGGAFTAVGTTTRNRIAAVNASDGSVITVFNPNANNNVLSMIFSASTSILYIGGDFTTISTTTRNRIAAVSTLDGSLVGGFDPNLNASVNNFVLSTSSNILYFGGDFTTVGTTTRNRIAAVNTSDGSLVSAFNPNASGQVSGTALSSDGNTLYLSGTFGTIGGVTRVFIGAVNTSDGSVVSTFNPSLNVNMPSILVLSTSTNTLYVAGQFTFVNGIVRNRLAAISALDGSLLSFDPNIDVALVPPNSRKVFAIAPSLDGNTLYAGGTFVTVGSLDRPAFASFPAVITTVHGRRPSDNSTTTLGVGGDTTNGTSTLEVATTTGGVATTTVSVTTTTSTTSIPSFTFTRVLRFGSVGEEVRQLQIFLNTHGFPLGIGAGSLGKETAYFGIKTRRALIKFQEAYAKKILVPQRLVRGTGLFVTYSRRVVNEIIAGNR